MRRAFAFVMVVVFFASMSAANPKAYADKWEDLITESGKVLGEVNSMPDTGIPSDMFKKCRAIAIFPSTVGGGFIFGAKYGQGVVLYRDDKGVWSPPAVFNIGGGSFGWQIGGQATDLILVMMNDRGVDGFLASKFTLGADASVAAGPVGRDTQASTDLQLKGGIFSYSRSRGAFAGVKVEGSGISQNKEGNKALYKQDLSAKEILKEGKAKPTAAGQALIKDLQKYSK
ncbi:MAG: lipid-binding SYLF domain-containing protein [Candidatus Omnitrophica bacterium]|nr:lipid-binding SYLF domain-containing protein [Candidatus Omnitrophota bacterium]